MADLSLRHVNKKYSSNTSAVKDFSIDIEDEEFVVLVGPSGCGKTTLLRMIAGLEDLTDGEIYIDGRRVNQLSAKDRDIAMVFQNYALYPHMTVYDNMGFALKLKNLKKKDINRKIEEAARILGIEHLMDRRPAALSGGEKQRAALGRAIVREPKIFLMDEPLANLDVQLRGQMRIEITKLHKTLKSTMIYVTHDQIEAMTMGDRIVVMKDGEVQQIDTPENIYNHPANLFVAGFIGSPQMNILEGTVHQQNNIAVVRLIDGTELAIEADMAEILLDKGYNDKNIYAGIRPEHLNAVVKSSPDKKMTYISGEVEVIENTGADVYLHLKKCGIKMIAKISKIAEIELEDQVNIAVNPSDIHFFDEETGEAIIKL